MDDLIEISVVLPCYLEADNLKAFLPELKQVMSNLSDAYEIIVIDTQQAKDSTPELCIANQVKYINRAPTDNYGDAFRTGLKVSRGKWLVFMDSDHSHPPAFIAQLLDVVRKDDAVSVVVASRYIAGGCSHSNPVLTYMSKLLNVIYSSVLKIKCSDVSNSFRIYRRDLLTSVELKCGHFDILEEVLFKLARKHKDFKLVELPFEFKSRAYGKSKRNYIVFLYNYLTTLFKLRYMAWRSK